MRGVDRRRQGHVAAERQLARAGIAQVGRSGRADHVHGGHGHHGGAARRARLGADGVLGLRFGRDGDALELSAGGPDGQLRAVLHGGYGVRAVHGHGDARAHPRFFGFLAAGGVRVHGIGQGICGVHAQHAVQLQVGPAVHAGLAVHGRDLHGDRAADADVALAVTRFGLGLDAVRALGVHLDVAGAGDGALDVGVVFAVRHGHRDARAQAGIHGGAVGLAGLKLAREADRHLRGILDRRGHFKGIGLVIDAGHDHLFGVGSVAGFDDRPERALLDLEVLRGSDGDLHLLAAVRPGDLRLQGAVLELRLLDGDLLERQSGLHGQLGVAGGLPGHGKARFLAADHGLAAGVRHSDAGDLVAGLELLLIRDRDGHLVAGGHVLLRQRIVLCLVPIAGIQADGLPIEGRADRDLGIRREVGHLEGVHILELVALGVLGFFDPAVGIAELDCPLDAVGRHIGHRHVAEAEARVRLHGDLRLVRVLELFVVQGHGAVLGIGGVHLEGVEILLEGGADGDGRAVGDICRVQHPLARLVLRQFDRLCRAGGVQPAGLQSAVQHVALAAVRLGGEEIGGLPVDRGDGIADRPRGAPLRLVGAFLLQGIVAEADRIGNDRLRRLARNHFAVGVLLGKGKADHGCGALIHLEVAGRKVHAVLAVLQRKLRRLALAALIVDQQRARDGISLLGLGREAVGVVTRILVLDRLDGAVLRGVQDQAVGPACFGLEAGILLRVRPFDGQVVRLFLFRGVLLGHGGAVGQVRDVGIGLGVHRHAARGHLRARVHNGVVIVIGDHHGDRAGGLGLALVRVLVRIDVFKFRHHGDAEVVVHSLRNGEDISALGVRGDDHRLPDLLVVLLDVIGDLEPALLQLFAFGGVGDQAQRVTGGHLVEALVGVRLRLVGQYGALVPVVQGELDIGVFLDLPDRVLGGVCIVRAAGGVVDQLLQVDLFLRFLVVKQVRGGGLDLLVALDLLILHEDGHVLPLRLEAEDIFVVKVVRVKAHALVSRVAGVVAAHLDVLDAVALPGGHLDLHGAVGIGGEDLHHALALGILVHLYGMIGRGDLIDLLFQLLLGALRVDIGLDLRPKLFLQQAGHCLGGLAAQALFLFLRLAALRAGGRPVVHLLIGGGGDLHAAGGGDFCVLAQLGLHVLNGDGNRHIAAGDALLGLAPVGDAPGVQIAGGGHLHVAARLQRAVHLRVHITDQHGHGDGKGRAAQGSLHHPGGVAQAAVGARGDLQIGPGIEGNVLRRFDDGALGDVHMGVHHAHAHGQGQAVGHLAIGIVAHGGVHLGVRLHGAKARAGLAGGKVISRVNLARDVHAGFGDLHIHQVDVRQQGDQAAGLLHLGQHDHVAGGVHRRLLADDDGGLVVDIDHVPQHVDPGGRGRCRLIEAGDRNGAFMGGILIREIAGVHAGAVQGLDLHLVGLQRSVHLDVPGLEHQLEAAHVDGGPFFDEQLVFAVHGGIRFDDHAGQRKRLAVLCLDDDALQIAGGRVDHIVGKRRLSDVIFDLSAVGRGELHGALVLQVVRIRLDALGNQVQRVGRALEGHVRFRAGDALGLRLVRAQRAGDVQAVAVIAALDDDLPDGVRQVQVDVRLVQAAAQIDADLRLGTGSDRFPGIDDVHRVIAGAGIHLDISGTGLGIHIDGIAALAGLDAGAAAGLGNDLHIVAARAGADLGGAVVGQGQGDGIAVRAGVDLHRAAVYGRDGHGIRLRAGLYIGGSALADLHIHRIGSLASVIGQLRSLNRHLARNAQAADDQVDALDHHIALEGRLALGLQAVIAGILGDQLQLKVLRDIPIALFDLDFALIGGVLCQDDLELPGQLAGHGLHGVVDQCLQRGGGLSLSRSAIRSGSHRGSGRHRECRSFHDLFRLIRLRCFAPGLRRRNGFRLIGGRGAQIGDDDVGRRV